jgi:hypothetical protein
VFLLARYVDEDTDDLLVLLSMYRSCAHRRLYGRCRTVMSMVSVMPDMSFSKGAGSMR